MGDRSQFQKQEVGELGDFVRSLSVKNKLGTLQVSLSFVDTKAPRPPTNFIFKVPTAHSNLQAPSKFLHGKPWGTSPIQTKAWSRRGRGQDWGVPGTQISRVGGGSRILCDHIFGSHLKVTFYIILYLSIFI